MPPKRILHLAESPYFGGITSHILSVVDAFSRRDDFEIVAATLPGRRADRTLIEGVRLRNAPIHVLRMRHAFDPLVIHSLKHLLRNERIDLIHSHNYRATLLAQVARGRLPSVNTCHGKVAEDSIRLKAWQALELIAMRRNHAVIACSNYVRRWLLEKGLPPDRVRAIYNGCGPPPETTIRNRAHLGVPANAWVVLFAGRLVPGKGLRTLFAAMKGLPNYHALVLGDGPLKEALVREASDMGVSASFPGAVSDVAAYYALADVVVLPSRMEALPVTLIEAAAHGKPAVASRVGGVPEVVIDEETGLLVDVGNVEQLRAALERLGDASLRRELGARARARWQREFTLERMAERLAAVYREVLEGNAARRPHGSETIDRVPYDDAGTA